MIADVVLCRVPLGYRPDGSTEVCGKPMLPDFPHHHETPPSPSWNPMAPRPQDPAQLIAFIRAEIRAEIPERLHVAYVPSRAEPVGVSQYSAGAAGYVPGELLEEVLDTGELGAPSWSPGFHRYVGSVTSWDGEITMRDEDLAPFPWLRQLEGVRRWCSSKHRAWYEHQVRPLCWTLIRHVVFGGYSIPRAGQLEDVTPATAGQLFFRAVDKWYGWVSNDLNAIELRRRRAPAA